MLSLKLGKWKINVNGTEGQLIIDSFQEENFFVGSIQLSSVPLYALQGFWDETARSILFVLSSLEGPSHETFPIQFKGFLFSTPTQPELGQDMLWTLTGYYQVSRTRSTPPFIGQARRNTFGWFAQTSEVA